MRQKEIEGQMSCEGISIGVDCGKDEVKGEEVRSSRNYFRLPQTTRNRLSRR